MYFCVIRQESEWKNTRSTLEQKHPTHQAAQHYLKLAQAYVWPWARKVSVQHDSYTCSQFPGSVGFPTARSKEPNNFVGAVVSEGHELWQQCPEQCRRQDHMDWSNC